jgi:hypothetical protein
MKDTILTLAASQTAIMATGAATQIVSIPAPEEIQSIGQLIIQAVIGIFAVIRFLRDKRKK